MWLSKQTWPQLFKERITLSNGQVAIQRIKCIGTDTFYPTDSELSAGWSYPLFEQLGPAEYLRSRAQLRVGKESIFIFWVCQSISRDLVQMDQSELRMKTSYLTLRNGRWRGVGHKHIRKAEEPNFKPNFSFFTSLSTAEAHVCGVKFIGIYGTVGYIAIQDFSLWGESDLWSDVWPAIEGVVCLSLLSLERETTISNNFTKRRYNITRIKRAFWLATWSFTICPWVHADDSWRSWRAI